MQSSGRCVPGGTRLAQALVVAALLTGTSGSGAAQSGGAVPLPAEAPPAGYAQDRYVDSRGCSFIRAEIGGTQRWVPLLRADRSQVCDDTPSVAAASAGAPGAVTAAPQRTTPTTARATPDRTRTAAVRTPDRAPRQAITRQAPDWSRGFVQVGAFAVPSNAAATEARFGAMGLPALQRRARARGRLLHLVQIGPLDGEALRDALATARAAGFCDAYVIR